MDGEIISRVLTSRQRPKPPLFFKLFGIFPVLRRIPARLIGIGIRPEHVRTPEAAPLQTYVPAKIVIFENYYLAQKF